MVNKVTLVGNLGRDPELRRLESGAAVAKFSIATSENYKDRKGEWQKQTEWHDIVLWRKLAEQAERQLKKGMLIYLEGKLSTRKWEGKDGSSHKSTEIIGSYLRILSRPEGQGASLGGDSVASSPPPSAPPGITLPSQSSTQSSGVSDAGDDGLPF